MSIKFQQPTPLEKTILKIATAKAVSKEPYNSNNGWGFGGLAGTKFNFSDGSYVVWGKVCYRHINGHHTAYLVDKDEMRVHKDEIVGYLETLG